ncbi:MAG: protein kinase [Gemmataceae bacterium]
MFDTYAELEAFFERLYQFRIVRKLGEGAFGLAILVFDVVEQEHKVFKLPKSWQTMEALKQEGDNLRALRKLLHPNIIQLNQYGFVPLEWDGRIEERYYLNMAYGGTSLREKLGSLKYETNDSVDEDVSLARRETVYNGSGTRLPAAQVVRIVMDVCRGLEAAHGFQGAQVRLLHCDVSPDNILIDDEGVARLSDFGIARVIDRASNSGMWAGKVIYLDPECHAGRVTVQSDLYSLGIVIHECLTGELPFSTFSERLKHPPTPVRELVPDVPEALEAIVLKALELDVDKRFRQASEMLSALAQLEDTFNPLPPRYKHVATLSDGRLLCEDREGTGRVAVRWVESQTPLEELAQQQRIIKQLTKQPLELTLDAFEREGHVGVVSPVPGEPTLKDRFPWEDLGDLDKLQPFCESMAMVADLLHEVHQSELCHGLLSPYAISFPSGKLRLHELGISPFFRTTTSEPISRQFPQQRKYMSPQIQSGMGVPTPADDVYAFGAILQDVLTPPITKRQDSSEKSENDEGTNEPEAPKLHQVNPLVPHRFSDLVERCLQEDPNERPVSLKEVASVLRSFDWPLESIEGLCEGALRVYTPGAGPSQLIAACELLDLALRFDPGNPKVHHTKGLVYMRNEAYSFAAEEFHKASRVMPCRELFVLLGEANENANQISQAESAYRKALEFEYSTQVGERLAITLKKLKQWKEAVELLKRTHASEEDPENRKRLAELLRQWGVELTTCPECGSRLSDLNEESASNSDRTLCAPCKGMQKEQSK